MWFGYYVQMLAAFLLLALTHYFTASFLPVVDCDETYNFVEPIHYLLFGTGKQTWENCPQYGLRSYLLAWVYAWPAAFLRGASGLSSVDVYYYLRIFTGRTSSLAELFFVYSVWSVFDGKTAMLALLLLLLNYPIPHAAVSMLPTSFAMSCYFTAFGCWLRTRTHTARTLSAKGVSRKQRRSCLFFAGLTVALVVGACVLGWPFAGLIAVPIGLDLLIRLPVFSMVCLCASLIVIGGASFAVDSYYFCAPVLSAWNIVKYNVFGGSGRGPELYGTEPWFFFFKNLLLNLNVVFLASLVAPLIVLVKHKRTSGAGTSRGRLLLYMSPFLLWLLFWTAIAHKEERFFSPAYPFLLFAAVVAVQQLFFPDAEELPRRGKAPRLSSTHRRRAALGVAFVLLFGTISFSRAMAIYHFYSGPERLLYDWFPLLQSEADQKHQRVRQAHPERAAEMIPPFNVCVGKEWYRFPSSFFIDHRRMQYSFIKTQSFSGLLPLPFRAGPGLLGSGVQSSAEAAGRHLPGACTCPSTSVNDLNQEIAEQYVQNVEDDCDVIFDSLPPQETSAAADVQRESDELHLHAFPYTQLSHDARLLVAARNQQPAHPVEGRYALLDVSRTPLWCRVLYYPFGISQRCARWRPLVLVGKQQPLVPPPADTAPPA